MSQTSGDISANSLYKNGLFSTLTNLKNSLFRFIAQATDSCSHELMQGPEREAGVALGGRIPSLTTQKTVLETRGN